MSTAHADLVALDLSLSGTGVAMRRGPLVALSTIRTTNPGHNFNGWSMAARHRTIVSRIIRYVGPATLVVKEERLPSMDVQSTSAYDLAGLHAVVEYVLASFRVPVVSVNLMLLKAYACKGNATKDDMLAAAAAHLSKYGKCFNDNEADALWLLAMASHKYGRPMHLPPTHRAARIDKVEWPQWVWPT